MRCDDSLRIDRGDSMRRRSGERMQTRGLLAEEHHGLGNGTTMNKPGTRRDARRCGTVVWQARRDVQRLIVGRHRDELE